MLAANSINPLAGGATYSNPDQKGTLFSNDTLEISGSGAVTVTGNYKHGMVSDDDLIITSGHIAIASSVTDGFQPTIISSYPVERSRLSSREAMALNPKEIWWWMAM